MASVRGYISDFQMMDLKVIVTEKRSGNAAKVGERVSTQKTFLARLLFQG